MSNDTDLEKRAMEIFSRSLEISVADLDEFLAQKCEGNTGLEARVRALLDADENQSSAIRTGGVTQDFGEDAMPERIGAYRINRLIGRGGMGSVYEGARDEGDFDHKVAVKVIQPSAFSEELVERFERERQLLARLNHPNIARLFDGGAFDDGSPYFVMEFVDGVTVMEWVEDKLLTLDDRISLFQKVCAAVRHAHQNLVVHRDITPSNILVTLDGDVKLIDFGIAKPHDSEVKLRQAEEKTHSPSLSFTPGYAVPERERSSRTNTLTDIYSLGMLLEEMTILNSPGKELHSIILKAKSHDPNDRYLSVDRLLEDIANFVGDHPVEAHNGGHRYKFSKFVTRHKFPVAAAAASIVGLFSAAVIMTMLFIRAEQAEQEASNRFQDVRSLAKTTLFEIYPNIEDLPGATSARLSLVQASQAYLENLVADRRASADLKLEAAQGFTELGRVMGSPSRSAFEESEQANSHYQQALNLLTPLLENEPENVDVLYAIGDLHYAIGELTLADNIDIEIANKHFSKAMMYLIRGHNIDPENTKIKLRLLSTRVSLADVLYRNDEHTESQSALREIISELDDYQAQDQQNLGKLLLLNKARRILGISVLNNTETRPDGIEPFLNATNNIEDAHRLSPRSNYINIELANSYRQLAFAHYMNEQHAPAILNYGRAIKALEKVVEFDPEDQQTALLLIYAKGEITAPLSSLERFKEAETLLLEVLNAYEKRLEEQPGNAKRLRNIMVHHYFLASHYRLRENTALSCKHIQSMGEYVEIMRANNSLQELDDNNWKSVVNSEYAFCADEE